MKGIDDGKIVVINDGLGVGPALVELLNKSGVQSELFDKVPQSTYAGVIFLGGLRDLKTVDDAIDVNREAFSIAKAIANSVNSGGIFVTLSDNGGSFGCNITDPIQAWSAGVTGLIRTAAIEWPTMTVKAIDIEKRGRDAAAIAGVIAKELLEGGSELEVGFPTDADRIVLESKRVSVEKGEMPITGDDVIVVSGGARGVTAVTMIELAKASKASFVLLGRSVIAEEPPEAKPAKTDAALKRVMLDLAIASGKKVSPSDLGRQVGRILASREILGTLSAIENAGGRAKYLSVDITNQDEMVSAFSEVRKEFGPISGIVHGAGVLADKMIAEKTDDQFNRVFNTKVEGFKNLLAATADDPIKLLCLFSSVAARTGNQGQSDYAMANEVLNKVAVAEHHRRGPSVVVKSLGWGPWEGGMVSPALKAHFESMGVALIPLEEGAQMLVDEIASTQFDQVELVLGGGVLEDSQTFAQSIT